MPAGLVVTSHAKPQAGGRADHAKAPAGRRAARRQHLPGTGFLDRVVKVQKRFLETAIEKGRRAVKQAG